MRDDLSAQLANITAQERAQLIGAQQPGGNGPGIHLLGYERLYLLAFRKQPASFHHAGKTEGRVL